jgi:Polyketide cyclase / dehydrase and lipid transport
MGEGRYDGEGGDRGSTSRALGISHRGNHAQTLLQHDLRTIQGLRLVGNPRLRQLWLGWRPQCLVGIFSSHLNHLRQVGVVLVLWNRAGFFVSPLFRKWRHGLQLIDINQKDPGQTLSETHIEEGKRGDAVGCICNVRAGSQVIRQRLLAHSDRDCSYTYALCEPLPFPLRDYLATLRITPVTDGARAFAEWWATFDCADNEHEQWTSHFISSFHKWLEALRCHLAA